MRSPVWWHPEQSLCQSQGLRVEKEMSWLAMGPVWEGSGWLQSHSGGQERAVKMTSLNATVADEVTGREYGWVMVGGDGPAVLMGEVGGVTG